MLPYYHRLLKRKDFEAVHKYGTFYSYGNMAVKFRKTNFEVSRIGIVIGIKFSKKAQERNLVKRAIREVMRKKILSIKKGLDIVFYPRKKKEEKTREINWQNEVIKAISMAELVIKKMK